MNRALPHARSSRTARFAHGTDPGRQSGLLLPPLAVLLVGGVLGAVAFRAGWSDPLVSAGLTNSGRLAPANGGSQSKANVSPVFRPEVLHWSDAIVEWASTEGLDPNLAAVVMQIESCGDPGATSPSGAIGLFQVMPFHFSPAEDPYRPATNAARGLAYLARSLRTSAGDARLALAGYNGGIGVIAWDERSWPQQTLRYVQFGASIYEDVRNGLASSPALQEWYETYGVSLCRQAASRLGMQ